MNKSTTRYLTVAWIVAMGWLGAGQAVLANQPKGNPRITIYIYNWAEIKPAALQEAKEVAARVFRKAGLEPQLLDHPLPDGDGPGAAFKPVAANEFFVHLPSPEMAKQMHLPTNTLGVAPGTWMQKERNTVYVFDQVASKLARDQVAALSNGGISFHANTAHILGYAIAHEIGHVLLNLKAHARRGIMQANLDQALLRKIAIGQLGFTPKEVASLQAEVVRRGKNS